MEKIRKAVITAAGSGSRLLPFSKETPKEMLPFCTRSKNGNLILKPILEVVYESLYNHGCRKFCLVVGRGKRSIEDYFLIDDSVRYSANSDLQEFYRKIRSSHIAYVQQSAPRGFGDAVLKTKHFVENDNFLLHAGDDVILSPNNSHIQRLEDAFFSHDADMAFLVENVENPERYGIVEGKNMDKGIIRVDHLEEKPECPKTNLAVIATYIFKPVIFRELERIEPDKNGEIQLSDAIQALITGGRCIAVRLEDGERRVDVGTPESYVSCLDDSLEYLQGSPGADVRS